jgi:mono/diheme cytochrome c family protein
LRRRDGDDRIAMKLTAMRFSAALLLLCALLSAVVWFLNVRGEAPLTSSAVLMDEAQRVAKGAYLARAGNCQSCHTQRGGQAYAGGRAVPTPFGTVVAPNLTSDATHGIGAWSADEFWRAMHHGRSRDGRLLYPAFPYANTTRITRADSDALLVFLRRVPASNRANTPHDLAFPFNLQASLAVWRALYFRPAQQVPDATRSAEWHRGAYLIEALGHCNACHAQRNALGASRSALDLAGGLIAVQNWYAPSLNSMAEAGVMDWDAQQVVDLLKHGAIERRGESISVAGPMSEVVLGSTQHLSDVDLRAMAAYLQALPRASVATIGEADAAAHEATNEATNEAAAMLYAQHCAQCHGEQGEGRRTADGMKRIYPALAGNRAVTLPSAANLVHVVLEGGFAPATAGNPRPFGMPPFATVLTDAEVALLLTHLRRSWGHRSEAVSALDVSRVRNGR